MTKPQHLSSFVNSSIVIQVTDAAAPHGVDSTLPSALRSDLNISHQLFEGRAYAIIKDPLSLKYFRLPSEDFALASLFDGKRNVAAIRTAFLQQQPQAALKHTRDELTERITRFANELLLSGFLEATAAGVRQQQKMEAARRPVVTPWGLFMKALFLKIPLFDPDALLIRMEQPGSPQGRCDCAHAKQRNSNHLSPSNRPKKIKRIHANPAAVVTAFDAQERGLDRRKGVASQSVARCGS
jgi:hypothetical protein